MTKIIISALLLSLLSPHAVLAQGNNNQPNNQPAPAPAPAPTDSSTTGNTPPAPTSNEPTSSSTGNSPPPAPTSTSTSASSAPPSTTNTPPPLSSSTSAPPLPTISGVLPPPLIVPDTSNAPFMQKSSLPEGTVFIAVGAALGFLGLCVLAWRGLIAWSLHRSVKRAADAAYAPDAKTVFGYGPHAGYKSMYNDSNMSLEQLSSSNTAYTGAAGTQQRASTYDRRTSKQPRPQSKAPTSSSLFFSPTAGGAAGGPAASNRSSTFLPSGYYASNATGGGASAGYGRVQSRDGLTPPDSPALRPQGSSHLRPDSSHGGGAGRHSTSARHSTGQQPAHEHRRSRLSSGQNLNAPSSQGPTRTPSALFDDLLENHGHGPGERF